MLRVSLISTSLLILAACGGDGSNDLPKPPDGQGAFAFEIEGTSIPERVRFEFVSERLAANVLSESIAVLLRPLDPAPKGSIEPYTFGSMTFEIEGRAPATYAGGSFAFDIVVHRVTVETSPQSLSFRPRPDVGEVILTEVTDTRVKGSFNTTASPTQVNAKDGVYSVSGAFDFVRCSGTFCL